MDGLKRMDYWLTVPRENQYRRKFSQWREEGKLPPKHYGRHEMLAIIQIGKQRKEEENKNTAFCYRGWEVEPNVIARFEERNSNTLAATRASPLGMAQHEHEAGYRDY